MLSGGYFLCRPHALRIMCRYVCVRTYVRVWYVCVCATWVLCSEVKINSPTKFAGSSPRPTSRSLRRARRSYHVTLANHLARPYDQWNELKPATIRYYAAHNGNSAINDFLAAWNY